MNVIFQKNCWAELSDPNTGEKERPRSTLTIRTPVYCKTPGIAL